jgi:hypothetical protein
VIVGRKSPKGAEAWFRRELRRAVNRDEELDALIHTASGDGRLELELDYRLGLKQRPEPPDAAVSARGGTSPLGMGTRSSWG